MVPSTPRLGRNLVHWEFARWWNSSSESPSSSGWPSWEPSCVERPISNPPPGRYTADDLPELNRQYAKWEMFAVLPFALGAIGFTWVSYQVLCGVAEHFHSWKPRPLFLVTLPQIIWLLPAMFLGMLSTLPVVTLLYGWLLGNRYADYTQYCDLKHGVNGRRFVGVLAWLLIAAGILLIPQMLHAHAAFYPNHMVTRGLLDLSQRRIDYKEIAALHHVDQWQAPNGDWKNRPHHAITFADGTHWRTNAIDDPDPIEDARLFEFLAKTIGLKVDKRMRLE